MKNPPIPSIRFDISEKDVEDVLFYGMKQFLNMTPMVRQFNTPVGIIDVIAKASENVYFIIELKKDTLNASAVCQVLRYCRYMNGEHSKDGKRIFLPLIIGKNLHEELFDLVEIFEDAEYKSFCDYGRIFYTLYDINPMSGFNFSYFNVKQSERAEYYETPMIRIFEEREYLKSYVHSIKNNCRGE